MKTTGAEMLKSVKFSFTTEDGEVLEHGTFIVEADSVERAAYQLLDCLERRFERPEEEYE
jgi:hypothetical protein